MPANKSGFFCTVSPKVISSVFNNKR